VQDDVETVAHGPLPVDDGVAGELLDGGVSEEKHKKNKK
jgi:hypothetical protein